MAAPPMPFLRTQSLPTLPDEAMSASMSPARGKEMKNAILGKVRPLALMHVWEFWHERQARQKKGGVNGGMGSPNGSESSDRYEDGLVHLATMAELGDFWKVFNNFDINSLPLKDSIHVFHRGVKPVWEDPRNMKGGCWTFRVQKDKAQEFWKHICMLAIGDQLQQAVASKRTTFIDDICGISYSVRFTSVLITIWNRDASHDEGKQRIRDLVEQEVPDALMPKSPHIYYKAHAEHAGFKGPSPDSSEPSSAISG